MSMLRTFYLRIMVYLFEVIYLSTGRFSYNNRNAIWDSIGDLYDLNLIVIPRENNSKADELAVAASTLQLPDSLIDENISVEVIFRPSVPDNMNHWEVFDHDK